MNGLPAYILIASLTIASPGPGVVLSISNSLKYGLRGAFPGIIGVAGGMLLVALASATSMGALLASSVTGFAIAKMIGAAYLIYLGIKMLRSSSVELKSDACEEPLKRPSTHTRFKEGVILSLSNPKPILFFIALFPQFIDVASPYVPQFLFLSATFCGLVLLIHSIYATFAYTIRGKIMSAGGFTIINRIGGACFLLIAGLVFYTTKFH
ncbi:LysE family transporter [Telmatospirillum sp.]|uniref:LysE family translocator n=1 Tax=Telmatospirillum sp. TaxID=2079197 RepID=UPI00283AF614|nr:LysE family transporter [Telmatospirillum sp.]MDR3439475.1 LysE family transporter [Telmatospirillum sp.]